MSFRWFSINLLHNAHVIIHRVASIFSSPCDDWFAVVWMSPTTGNVVRSVLIQKCDLIFLASMVGKGWGGVSVQLRYQQSPVPFGFINIIRAEPEPIRYHQHSNSSWIGHCNWLVEMCAKIVFRIRHSLVSCWCIIKFDSFWPNSFASPTLSPVGLHLAVLGH